jgi:alpha-1,3-rhamnosyl/mannosyltransferase
VHDEIALACLYSGAALLVQPSLAEGFGLPPLEAMACGVPVLSSDAGSLPEVLGDAAVYRPPADPAAWAAAVLELLADGERRTALGARGRAHAAGYTWERTAELTRAIYAEAVAERR